MVFKENFYEFSVTVLIYPCRSEQFALITAADIVVFKVVRHNIDPSVSSDKDGAVLHMTAMHV